MDRLRSAATGAVGASTAENLQEFLMAVWERIRPYFRGAALEYGRTSCEVEPHDPADGGVPIHFSVSEEDSEEANLEDKLGKAATRGHIANNGTGVVHVAWQPWARTGYQGEYRLAPGATLDTSSMILSKVRITAPKNEGQADVQTFWQ